MPSPRQTLSYLSKKFQAVGLQPDSRRGQNFLVDLNLLGILIEAAELTRDDVVLEVGTGTGSLTAYLAAQAGHVLTVEIDARLQRLARESLIDQTNVSFLGGDILKNKNRLRAEVLEAVDEQLHQRPEARFKLVANLPYSIATPLISNLLLVPRPPERMIVTIQRELAERMTATPRTKDYSALSVWMQSFCDAEVLRILPPSVFWPRPKVYSAIMRIVPDRNKLAGFAGLVEYNRFLRSIFLLRRKYLRSVVVSVKKHQLTKPEIDKVLTELGHGPQSRAEELSVAEHEALFQALWALESTKEPVPDDA